MPVSLLKKTLDPILYRRLPFIYHFQTHCIIINDNVERILKCIEFRQMLGVKRVTGPTFERVSFKDYIKRLSQSWNEEHGSFDKHHINKKIYKPKQLRDKRMDNCFGYHQARDLVPCQHNVNELYIPISVHSLLANHM